MSQPTADDLRRWDRRHVWHAFTQMAEYEPLIIERAAGCRLWDDQGQEWLDGTSSLWCNIHGHRHPALDAAIVAQLGRVAHTTLLGMSNPATIELARQLVERAPGGPLSSNPLPDAAASDTQAAESSLEHVFFSDDGSTAIEAAIKIALQYWRQRDDPRPQKTLYLSLGDAYHGDTLGSVSVGGVERFHQMFNPLLFPAVRIPSPHSYRWPEGTTVDSLLAELDRLLAERHEQIAALVIEPLVQCAAGIWVHPPGYLRGVRQLTRKWNVLLIADEVAVGFGRTGTLFACEQENVVPDILCVAKGITGGYLPLAATLVTSPIYEAFLGSYAQSKTLFHGHTYGGNPLAAAVALASLAVFDREKVLEHLPAKIQRLKEHLARIAQHPHVGDVRQRGMIAGVELVRDRASRQPYDWEERRGWQACEAARREHVLIRPLGNVVVLFPSLSVTLDELDQICAAAERGIIAATAS